MQLGITVQSTRPTVLAKSSEFTITDLHDSNWSPILHHSSWSPSQISVTACRHPALPQRPGNAARSRRQRSAADRARLESLLRRGKRLVYCTHDVPTVVDLFNSADDDFFHRVQTNSHHVLQPYLPDQIDIPYELRTRSHNMTLINKT